MGHILNRKSLVAVVLVLVGVVTTAAWQGESRSEVFQGWITYQDGQVRHYSREEWSIDSGIDSFTLRRSKGGDFVTYYGTFRVVELDKEKPLLPGGESEPFSWKVEQDEISHVYTKNDGWSAEINYHGIQLEKQKTRVWYYGSSILYYRDR